MNWEKFAAYAAAMVCYVPLTAFCDQAQLLDGTWVIDAKQTVEHIEKSGPPSHNKEWLPSVVLRQCVITITFDGGSLILDPISPAPMVQSFRLEPQPDRKWTYTVRTADGGNDILIVSFLSSESITVKSAKIGLDEYGVWKRGTRPNRQTAEQDFKRNYDACAEALANVSFIKAQTR